MVDSVKSAPTPISGRAGDDKVIGSDIDGSLTVLKAMREYKKEAEDARKTRMRKNLDNRRAYLGIQDWEHKGKGQSKEFLPKTPVAVEQFVGFVKRALTQFGAYYEVKLPSGSRSPISENAIRNLMECHLSNILVDDNRMSSFPVLISDAIKVGALESLVIFKVHGNMKMHRKFRLEPGTQQLTSFEQDEWNLRVDLIRPEDYYPDPTGAGLYEIQSTTKDLHYLKQRAKEGIYDKAAVNRVEEDFRHRKDNDRRAIDQGQDEAQKPSFRKQVLIDEFWGTLVDAKGEVLHENVFCAMANNKYLIRKPTPNPFWHQESPFVAEPILRVPFSVWHKALFDHAVEINFAANEIFNLIIDGGISSVWGIKQLRVDDLQDPGQVSNGISQGDTLVVKSTLPHNAKVLETVTEGKVPTDAMAVLEMLSREFAASALSSELKLGTLPGKEVLATEIVELSQSQAITTDGIVSDIERSIIGGALRKIWLTILQNMDDVSSEVIINAVGMKTALVLSKMTPEERFAVFANQCSFKVNGLSAMLAKVRDFQKVMALLQSVMSNPLLMQAFFKKYSPNRILSYIMKTLAINPEDMERDEAEISRIEEELKELPAFMNLTGNSQAISAQNVGEPQLPAEIDAMTNPTASLAGAHNS